MTILKTAREKGAKSPRRVQLDFSQDPGKTKQEFRKECDINNILAKFRKTGALTHVRTHGAVYGDATGTDFLEAMNVVAHGNTLWEELPSHIKVDFNGPADLLDFVAKPENADEVKKLFGEAPAPAEIKATPPNPATPAPASPTAEQPSVPSEE